MGDASLIVQLGPLITLGGTLVSLLGSAAIALYFGPRGAERRAAQRQDRAWETHLSDTIRDFRESHAVLRSISEDGYRDSFPVLSHITKLGVPESLLTTKIIAIGDLPHGKRALAMRLENILVNVNRDIGAIVRLIEQNRRETFDSAAAELADKFYNLASAFLRDNPHITPPAQDDKPKTIVYEDGTVRTGVAFRLRAGDESDDRLRPSR